MPKQNLMLAKIEAKYAREYSALLLLKEQEYHGNLATAMQIACDAAAIAYGHAQDEETAINPAEFQRQFARLMNDIGHILSDDGKDDKDLVYSTTTIDKELKKYTGDAFLPWDVRYAPSVKQEATNESEM